MSFSPADSALFAPLFTDLRVAKLFGDEAMLARMVEFEAALARVEGRLGVIPAAAGEELAGALSGLQLASLDIGRLAGDTARDGVPVPGLLGQLRERLRETAPGAEPYLHWGATSQDVMDTAFVLQLRAALEVLAETLEQTIDRLSGLARAHRLTPMLGRTHGRHAVPISFGLKVAGWLAPLLRHQERLDQLRRRVLVLQLGGAAGTLAPLGTSASDVRAALAAELGLGSSTVPWHTARDGFAELAGWLAAVSGSLAKVAQDVILLSQEEVAEVRESAGGGGSSTMPQKSNPIRSEMIIAAARANAGLVSTMHHALIQEHERATHGWQLEWTALPQMVAYASSALEKGAELAGALVVNEERMRLNLEATNGLAWSEALTFALARHLPRTRAAELVAESARRSRNEGLHLFAAAREMTDAPVDWEGLRDPAGSLGAAGELVDALLSQVEGRDDE
ncbi:MAG TPA: 3-carboxy-cis,cis-muconate cycloisomerase [Trueperaceae bacterium]|nr:3-carboxy-cis,cis-muconate cycloisomerase [Trueperaceae bacterium]